VLSSGSLGKPGINPPQGRAAASLEQVLQAKISGSSALTCAAAYRSSPLALLLKPCFEGNSSLCFIHCLRLEQSHLFCLAQAAPLLVKIHRWLCMVRNSRQSIAGPSALQLSNLGVPRKLPTVPPLQLSSGSGGGTGGSGAGRGLPQRIVDDGDLSDCSDETMSSGGSPAQTPAVAVEVLEALACEQPPLLEVLQQGGTGDASSKHPVPPEEAGQNGDPDEDTRILHYCSDVIEVKIRSAEILEKDAGRSSAMLRELDVILGQLIAQREVAEDTGPNERETNLKIVYEHVYRSVQRSIEEASRIRADVEVLNRFCTEGSVMPAYDSYKVTQQDVELMKEHQPVHQQKFEVVQPPAFSMAASSSSAAPNALQAPVTVPHLRLSCLPQEHPQLALPQEPTSPSSVSSCSAGSFAGPPGGLGTKPPGKPVPNLGSSLLTGGVATPVLPLGVPLNWASVAVSQVPGSSSLSAAFAGTVSPPVPARRIGQPPVEVSVTAFRSATPCSGAIGLQEVQRSASAVRLPSGHMVQLGASEGLVTKSQSTTTLWPAGGIAGSAARLGSSAVPPQAMACHGSPMIGHRVDMAMSPLLGSSMPAGAGSLAVAPGGAAGAPPPQLPKGRQVTGQYGTSSAVPSRPAQAQVMGARNAARTVTPAPPKSSSSPVMLTRAISAQALRPAQAPNAPLGHARVGVSTTASGVSPMRGAWGGVASPPANGPFQMMGCKSAVDLSAIGSGWASPAMPNQGRL